MSLSPVQSKATRMLVLCTALWGVSFPTMKALGQAQQALVPDGGSWFFAALLIVYRFGISTLIMAAVAWRTIGSLTRLEWSQGIGLGLFGGIGILFQIDGLAHTSASTSAFLTQCYCVIIPMWVALRERRWPAPSIFIACALVTAGVAVLSGIDWKNFHLGRGEWETILASIIFTGQILWLERPKFAANNVVHFSAVMFAVMALVALPVALATTPRGSDMVMAFRTVPTVGLMAILVTVCTLGGYMLMNHWQRHLPATHAGLIYCLEPVFASACALVLPAWYSRWAGIDYANEHLTQSLLIGGTLITAANIVVQWPFKNSPSPGIVSPEKIEVR